MTTAVYYICDACGDEIKDHKMYESEDEDIHYHIHCVTFVKNV